MKHRLFLIFLFCSIALEISAPAHSSATTIFAIMSSDQPRYREAHRSFAKSIAVHGYTSPDTQIILHTPDSEQSSWNSEIHKLNRSKPDLIMAYGAPAALVAVREAIGIPVVSVDFFASDKKVRGLCGVSSRVSMVTLLNTLKKIRQVNRFGILYSPDEAGSLQQRDDIRKSADQLGVTLLEASAASSATLDSELNRLLAKTDAIIVTEGGLFAKQFDQIIARATAKNIPVASTMPDAADRGALISLEVNPREQGYLAAEMAARVLEGAQTDHLPLIHPNRIDLVINMRHAKKIGIEIPFPVLQKATRLIK
ncbi:MAG: ABC transporter substrate-binding protein [Desulfuromonadaceae bacterium]|nr:ABC transporter substrate-binding protein [Desulfuromonadaceae bacterium]